MGKLLGRNQYGIVFSLRCNFACSYCCSNVNRNSPKSVVEENPRTVIDIFNKVEEGLILISGGEPALWRDLPTIIESLPQHYWVILSNLFTVPKWFKHPNIKLIIPAFHEEFIKPDKFLQNILSLRDMGKRQHIKLVVKPNNEYSLIPHWEKWNSLGIPTSLAPLEYNNFFKKQFLKDLIGKYLTSCLYNGRFFKAFEPKDRLCYAGTNKAFQLNPDGDITRCSTVGGTLSNMFEPSYNKNSENCNEDCFCEWHHWGEMALANDNHVWEKYINSGIWENPSGEDLYRFVRAMQWNVCGRNIEGDSENLFSNVQLLKDQNTNLSSSQSIYKTLNEGLKIYRRGNIALALNVFNQVLSLLNHLNKESITNRSNYLSEKSKIKEIIKELESEIDLVQNLELVESINKIKTVLSQKRNNENYNMKNINKPAENLMEDNKMVMFKLIDYCKQIEKNRISIQKKIFSEFNLLSGHPWEKAASDPSTNYYDCLFHIVKNENPKYILEIGTAFGMSGSTMISASENTKLFITLDLGIYNLQLNYSENNIDYSRNHIHKWCTKNNVPLERIRFYRTNTQPNGKGDNSNEGSEIPHWYQIPELLRILQANNFDIIFVDGKHTEDGLLNDLNTFWPFLKPGGLLICDDLHDPIEYKNTFSWVGDTWHSFHSFLVQKANEISDYYIWNYPRVPPEGKNGLRPFGLLRKSYSEININNSGFDSFDTTPAFDINHARLDHLASLNLELVNSKVLEVGAGVGWHTEFFERLGCSVLSTDARADNVLEHRRRFPHRKVEVADLTIPGEHCKFGSFEIVYCYGTLYHLSDPEVCINELSKVCNKYLLLETCVNTIDNGKINIVSENKDNPNQSFEGLGSRPARNYLWSLLKKYFPYVYISKTQPNHPDFPLKWPVTLEQGVQNARCIFVASKEPISNILLSEVLIDSFDRLDNLYSVYDNYKYSENQAWVKEKILEAEKYIEEENFGKAVDLLSLILEYDNKNIDALNDLAVVNILLNNLTDAKNILSFILQLNPSDEIALENLKVLQNEI